MDSNTVNSWRRQNKALFYRFPGEWVAFNPAEGILGHHKDVEELVAILKAKGKSFSDFVLKYVEPLELPGKMMRILPIRVYGVRRHDWSPDYYIGLQHEDVTLNELMLIDSGADISVISKKTGELLGLTVADAEDLQKVGGVGGGVIEYAPRKIHFIIDGNSVLTPIAWLQDDSFNELIVGREVIFDKFDIEFKQADEQIIFRFRKQPA